MYRLRCDWEQSNRISDRFLHATDTHRQKHLHTCSEQNFYLLIVDTAVDERKKTDCKMHDIMTTAMDGYFEPFEFKCRYMWRPSCLLLFLLCIYCNRRFEWSNSRDSFCLRRLKTANVSFHFGNPPKECQFVVYGLHVLNQTKAKQSKRQNNSRIALFQFFNYFSMDRLVQLPIVAL